MTKKVRADGFLEGDRPQDELAVFAEIVRLPAEERAARLAELAAHQKRQALIAAHREISALIGED